MRRRLWSWGPAVLQMLVIFAASSMESPPELPGGVSDKAGHSIGYFVLGGLVLRALADARWAGLTRSMAWRAWVISATYGISDEFHQSFVPGRSPSIDDWIADASGAAAAVVLVLGLATAVRARGREV